MAGIQGVIDELTQCVMAAVREKLEPIARDSIRSYFMDGLARVAPGAPRRRAHVEKKHEKKAARPVSKGTTEARAKKLIAAVKKLGSANVAQVAQETGLKKPGLGSSLYHLTKAGKLTRLKNGKYRKV